MRVYTLPTTVRCKGLRPRTAFSSSLCRPLRAVVAKPRARHRAEDVHVSPSCAWASKDSGKEAQAAQQGSGKDRVDPVMAGRRQLCALLAAGATCTPLPRGLAWLDLCAPLPAEAKPRAELPRVGERGSLNSYRSDDATPGRPFSLSWPGGWVSINLAATARQSVLFSAYDPDDPAQQLAVYIKPVPGQQSVEDQGTLKAVATKFASAAPGQINVGQRTHVLRVQGKPVTVYEVETEVGGGTAGRFGSAVELLNILVIDEMEYTIRATSTGLMWKKNRGTLRQVVRTFEFTESVA